MAKQSKSTSTKPEAVAPAPESRSLKLAERGPKTLMDIAEFSLATACDVIRGAVTPEAANSCANNVGKTLKGIEMQLKHGPKGGGSTTLLLGAK